MPPVRFQKILIADERYESAGVFDVNNDGVLDIVSGGYWYPGPDFKTKHKIGNIRTEGEYFDDFSTIPMDINGDGYLDFVTGGWWGDTLRWRENPKGDGAAKEWPEHVIATVGNIETTRAWDVDGDGQLEIVPNTPNSPLKFYKLITDDRGKGTGKFKEFVISQGPSGHGFGFGDVDGDGRGEILLTKGFLKAPADPHSGLWTFHPEWDFGMASCPMLVADVNGDGVNEIVCGQAHGYGLAWYEPRTQGGNRTWIKHEIDPDNSQYHDMFWVDIDGDGKCELVTGKRYRAHCGHDPGEYDPAGLYYFKFVDGHFVKQVIDWGSPRGGSGCGISFQVVDIDGDGRLDIVAPGKGGLFLHKNLGVAPYLGC